MMQHFEAANARLPDHTHVLILATGSVASVKIPLIVKELLSVRSARAYGQFVATSLRSFGTARTRERAGRRDEGFADVLQAR